MFNCLFSDFDTRIITKRQYLKPNKLLAELFPKAVAHATKKLYSNYPIILIRVIMSHLYDMLEHKIPTIFIIKFMRNLP